MTRFCLAIGLVLMMLGTAIAAPAEPAVRGKTAREWLKQLEDPKAEAKVDAIRALSVFEATPEIVSALVEAGGHPDKRVRENALDSLSYAAPRSEQTIRLAKRLAEDEVPEIRRRAVFALRRGDPKEVTPILIGLLKDSHWWVRQAAVEGLAQTDPDIDGVIPALASALDDAAGGGNSNCSVAARALAKIGPKAKAAVPALLKAAKTDDDRREFRSQVAVALWKIDRHPEAVPTLERVLRDPEGKDSHQYLAAEALARIRPEGVTSLVAALGEKDAFTRYAAARALSTVGNNGRSAIPALKRALQDRSPTVRVAAASTLWDLERHPDAILTLIKVMEVPVENDPAQREDVVDTAREAAIAALDRVGPAAKRAVPVLGRVLETNWPKRRRAASLLGELGTDALPALPSLRAALNDRDAGVRGSAAWAIGAIGVDAKDAATDLTALLDDTDAWTREKAAQALWRVAGDPAGVPWLVQQLRENKFNFNRAAAAQLLAEMTLADGVLKALAEALTDKDDSVREAAAKAIGRANGKHEPIAKALRQCLTDKSGDVRLEAAWALWQREKDAVGVPVIIEALKSSDRGGDEAGNHHANRMLTVIGPAAKEHREALSALMRDSGEIGVRAAEALWCVERHPKAMPKLVTALSSTRNFSGQYDACRAVARIGPPAHETIPTLVKLLADDQDERLRVRAAQALGVIGPASREAVPALLNFWETGDTELRDAAGDALKRIDPEAARKAGVR